MLILQNLGWQVQRHRQAELHCALPAGLRSVALRPMLPHSEHRLVVRLEQAGASPLQQALGPGYGHDEHAAAQQAQRGGRQRLPPHGVPRRPLLGLLPPRLRSRRRRRAVASLPRTAASATALC